MQKGNSPAYLIASLPEQERTEYLNSLTDEEAASHIYDWSYWARENQLPPQEEWFIWLLLSGRGFGKTRIGSELVREWAKDFSPIALVGQTKADVRDTMVEVGDSSILKISPPWFMPEYEPSKRRLTWPNGAQAIIYSGDEPDQLRGPQHQKAWVDELAKFQYPQKTWDNLMMGLRIGEKPQCVVTSTPRPIKLIKEIAKDTRTVLTRGHTLDNRLNLSTEFLNYILSKYEGTRLGRQELAGEILDSTQGLVYDAFDSEACIIPRRPIPNEWPRYFCMDFGMTNTAALWYAYEEATKFLYLYRIYKKKSSVADHVKTLKELSGEESIIRKVGGNHQEQQTREAFSLAGWHIIEPKFSSDRLERFRRVNSLHAHNRVYVFNDLADYIDEKMSFSWEIDKDENMIEGRIHQESTYHYMSAESYLLSEFNIEVPISKQPNIIEVQVPRG